MTIENILFFVRENLTTVILFTCSYEDPSLMVGLANESTKYLLLKGLAQSRFMQNKI